MSSAPGTAEAAPTATTASPLRLLAPTPRIFAFAAVMLVAANSLGAKEVARWQYLQQSFDGAWGVGLMAAVTALSAAAFGLTLGRLLDRQDPRRWVLTALGVAAAINLVLVWALAHGSVTIGLAIVDAIVYGVPIGIGAAAILKVQASIVRPGAEGGADILYTLRLGIGGVTGAVLGGLSSSPAHTLLWSTALLIACLPVLAWIMRPITLRPRATAEQAHESLLAHLQRLPGLRSAIVVDLALALIIPTQLVTIVLAHHDLPELAAQFIAAGMVGVLAGRLLLIWRGLRDRPRGVLLVTLGVTAVIQASAAVLLGTERLLENPQVTTVFIVVGAATSTYAVSYMSALIQQGVPEDIRGRLTGFMTAGRSVFIAGAALVTVMVAERLGSVPVLVMLASALTALIVVTRAFRRLGISAISATRPASP